MTVADQVQQWIRACGRTEAERRWESPASAGATGDEDELVLRCLAGELRAFDALVLAYRSRIDALARVALGSREEALDVTQETFVRAFESLPRYRPQGRFRTWLYTIAANLCKNRLKARRPAVSWDEAGQWELLIDPAPGPEAVTLARERLQALAAAVEAMGDRDRLIVLLYYQDDLSVEEIARIVGCRPGAAKVALHRARARLRERLAQQGLLEGE
jgi:RNA polymerase sigma-70 factor, ECF subfamily